MAHLPPLDCGGFAGTVRECNEPAGYTFAHGAQFKAATYGAAEREQRTADEYQHST